MVKNMTVQTYFMVNEATNVCDNTVMWDGNPDTWTPPAGYLMLVRDTTPAKVWELNTDKTAYVLTVYMGEGQIGYTWDGTYLITNDPQPAAPVQPTTTGTQTL